MIGAKSAPPTKAPTKAPAKTPAKTPARRRCDPALPKRAKAVGKKSGPDKML